MKIRLQLMELQGLRFQTGVQSFGLGAAGWQLNLEASIDAVHSHLRLKTGEHPGEYRSFINVYTAQDGERDGIGTLHYAAASGGDEAMLFFEVHFSQAEMDYLIGFVRSGHCPFFWTMDIDHESVKFGFEPDGSGRDWDNVSHPEVKIAAVRYDIDVRGFSVTPQL